MRVKSLGDNYVCQIILGQSPKSSSYNSNGIGMPFFQGKKEFGKVHPKVEQYTTEPKKIAEVGDILLSVRAPVGPTNIANIQCCIGRGLGVIRPNQDNISTNYLLYFFKKFELEISNKGRGSTFSAITRKDLESIQIPIPPLTQQKTIAKTLDKAKELIELRKASIEKLDELSKSVFIDMFGDPVENPMGWEVVKLKAVLMNIDSGWSPVCHTHSRSNNNYGILKLSALTDDKYHQDENKEMKEESEPKIKDLVSKNDLLFSRKNTYERVGSCAYVFDTEDNLFMPDLIFRLNTNNLIDKIFLWKYLSNETVKIRLRNIASGASASMPNISKTKLLDFKIYLPSLDLQNKFAKTIQKIESQKALYEKELVKLEENFEALLAKSFG